MPLSPIVNGDPGALLVTEIEPVMLPDVVGANVTVNELVAPGLSVPAVKPLIENPVPEALAAETDTGAVPVFVSVMVFDVVLSTSTLPKLTLDGFAESAP